MKNLYLLVLSACALSTLKAVAPVELSAEQVELVKSLEKLAPAAELPVGVEELALSVSLDPLVEYEVLQAGLNDARDFIAEHKSRIANYDEVDDYLQTWKSTVRKTRGCCGTSCFNACPVINVCPAPCPPGNPCIPTCFTSDIVMTDKLGSPMTTNGNFYVYLVPPILNGIATYSVSLLNPLCTVAVPVVSSSGTNPQLVGFPTNSSFLVTNVTPGDTLQITVTVAT